MPVLQIASLLLSGGPIEVAILPAFAGAAAAERGQAQRKKQSEDEGAAHGVTPLLKWKSQVRPHWGHYTKRQGADRKPADPPRKRGSRRSGRRITSWSRAKAWRASAGRWSGCCRSRRRWRGTGQQPSSQRSSSSETPQGKHGHRLKQQRGSSRAPAYPGRGLLFCWGFAGKQPTRSADADRNSFQNHEFRRL